MQLFQNMQCSILDMLHIFMIPYDNYHNNIVCLGLQRVFILSTKYLSSYWRSSLVLNMRIHTMNIISVFCIHKCEHNHPMIFFLFICDRIFFLDLTITHTWTLFVFIRFLVARNHYVDDLQLIWLSFLLMCPIASLKTKLNP